MDRDDLPLHLTLLLDDDGNPYEHTLITPQVWEKVLSVAECRRTGTKIKREHIAKMVAWLAGYHLMMPTVFLKAVVKLHDDDYAFIDMWCDKVGWVGLLSVESKLSALTLTMTKADCDLLGLQRG